MSNENSTAPDVLAALVEAAEAEAVEAEARAEAARARARAVRLRHGLAEPADADADAESAPPGDSKPPGGVVIRRPQGRTIAIAAAVVVFVALSAINGTLAWHHYSVNRDHQRAAEFIAAARQGVVNMTTLDFNRAEADVARVLDGATGEFRTDFTSRVNDFTKTVKDSKAVTTGVVNAAAVESMTADSGVVLVSATSTVTNADGAKEEPRKWRLSVTVSRDGDRLKMSNVEFVA